MAHIQTFAQQWLQSKNIQQQLNSKQMNYLNDPLNAKEIGISSFEREICDRILIAFHFSTDRFKDDDNFADVPYTC